MTGILDFPTPPAGSAGRRRKYCSSRVIPSLRRHETMLFGSLKPVACQSQENTPIYFDADEVTDLDLDLTSLSSSMNSSQGSVAFSEG